MKYLTISLKLMSFFYAAKGSMHHVAVAMVIFPYVLKITWLLFSHEDYDVFVWKLTWYFIAVYNKLSYVTIQTS